MRFTTPDGRSVYVPGVYNQTRVISNLPGPLPEFHVPIVIGEADEALYPATFASTKQVIEATRLPFNGCGTSSKAKEEFGQDSNIGIGMTFAKRHGLPWAYIVAINALTRALIPANSTGPIVEGSFFAKKYGAVGGHIKLQVVAGTTLVITPVKRYSLLTANAALAATRVYVKDASWLQAGDTITIGANAVANDEYVVSAVGTSLSSTGQMRHYVDLTTGLGSAVTTAGYGMILTYDTDNTEEPAAFATLQEMADWCNETSEHVGFQEAVTFTNPAALIALPASTAIKEIAAWGVAVPGTSPAAVLADYTNFITALDATLFDFFAVQEQVIAQAFLVLSSTATVQAAWRDWAIAKRVEGQAVSVTFGCAWGDVAPGAVDDTNPTVRAMALNSQDVALCAGGLDKIAAYLSLAPAVFGRRIAGGVGHNLTNDDLIYTEVEKYWDERNSGELTKLHKKGVITYRLAVANTVRFVISQGVSTLQNNSVSWNVSDASTPLLMQRDLADSNQRVISEDLDSTQLGGDEITPSSIATVIVRRCQKSLQKRGRIVVGPTGQPPFQINSITLADNGAGWDADVSLTLPVTNDFIGLRTNILVGE